MSKFAKTTLTTVLLSVLMCIFCSILSASVQPKRVLVICSHSETSDYAENMLSPLVELSHNREDIRIFTAYLRMTSLSGVDELKERVQQIAEEFTPRPDLVVIVGGSGYMLADCVEKNWPGMPMVLAGENDYICPPDYTIRGIADDSVEHKPVAELRPADNMTLIYAPVYVDRTIELLKSLIPSLENIYIVAGENYYSRQQQILFEKTLKEFYPSIHYELLLSTEMTTEQLIGRMQYVNPEKDGVIFMSWLNHNDYLKNLFISNNVLRMIDDYAPVVSMSYCDLSSVKSTLGFWSFDFGAYNSALTSTVLSVLDNGVQPRDMDFVTIKEGMPFVNVAALEKYNIPKKYAPKYTFFANRSMSRNYFLKWMIFTILFFGLLFALVTFSIASNRLARHRKKANIELEELADQLRVANAEALRAQKDAIDLKERAEKDSAMKSLFLQNMSHDVRTPLNAIVGFSQLLGLPDEYLEEGDKDKFVSYITNNSNVLMMLVDDILNMSDVESGRYKIVMQQARVNEICRMCQKTVEYRLQPGVQLDFTTDADDELTVKTDPRRVQQILTNFLTNACKHTLSGQIVIDCDSTSDPDRILFSVTDTGPGIPPEKREKIFERFTKLDAYVDGAGIGLNICTTLAQKLGAEVRLDPTYTSGARFILAIPRNA